ncbi:uncharacterized protein LOC143615732 [Bidens hawaiensis]|uniref:uncharacterized protein LOC143615732 n=1 Tax=Bidens hawaiensis TaxID=980011 RepID=UPI00404A15D7
MVYGKEYRLPVALEHRAYWALRSVNLDLTQAAKNQYLQILELEEMRDEAYARSWSYKERRKALHDRKLKKVKEFKCKLRSRWVGPYTVKAAFPHGAVELVDQEGRAWKVNGHRLKHYIGLDAFVRTQSPFGRRCSELFDGRRDPKAAAVNEMLYGRFIGT